MPTTTINGKPYEFTTGETIIRLASRNQIEIPYYCWHPRLTVAANCRMCLVEVEKAPKPVPACQTECRDGMVVHTNTPSVKALQRAIHEFLLVNHPIDCPICDQAGECKLQDYYMHFQLASSPMHEPKVRKSKLETLGPYVIYDAERCIMCTRCVRFMEEVAGERQLGTFARGDRSYIDVFPGQPLDNPYSLNTVDVCPVGALTSSVFRFKQRVWNLQRKPGLCGGCARGCNVHVDFRARQVYRLLPRENEAVNKSWLCDEGRLTYMRANTDCLTGALMRKPGVPGAEREESGNALDTAVRLLTPFVGGKAPLSVALSLHATCEETYLFARLAKEVLGVPEVGLIEYAPGPADALLRAADRNPNRAGILRVLSGMGMAAFAEAELLRRLQGGQIKGLIVLGHQSSLLTELAAASARLEVFVHIAHARTALAEAAQVTLPAATWVQVDGTWINGDNRAQRLLPAFACSEDARPALTWLAELATGLGSDFVLSSAQTVRADMMRRLSSFADSRLMDIGPEGHTLAAVKQA